MHSCSIPRLVIAYTPHFEIVVTALLSWSTEKLTHSQTFEPLSHANLECLKKSPKILEFGTSDLEFSKICVK